KRLRASGDARRPCAATTDQREHPWCVAVGLFVAGAFTLPATPFVLEAEQPGKTFRIAYLATISAGSKSSGSGSSSATARRSRPETAPSIPAVLPRGSLSPATRPAYSTTM